MAVDRSRLPALGDELPFTFPAIAKTSLPDGPAVWSVEHHELPVIAFLLLLPVGAAADPPQREGLAALTGDLLDEGSGHRSAIEMHEALARIGAQFDTEIGADATILTITTLSRFRTEALGLLADMVLRPRLEAADFERVRELRLNRLVQLRDVPASLAERAFARLIYGTHPYGHLAIGNEADLRAITLEEVVRFHRTAYRASKATLIAVGDISAEELRQLAGHHFGAWRDAGEAQDVAPADLDAAAMRPPAPPAERLAIVHRSGAAQSELRMGHVATSRRTDDYHALLVLNMVLGGQFVSRINMNLREDKGYTYGARTSFDFRRGLGPFVLQVSVQTDATAAAVGEVLGELAAIRGDRPPTAHELDLARAALTRGYPRNFETAEQIARAAVQLALYDLPDDYFTTFVPRVTAVDAPAVTRAALKYLDPARVVTVVVGDREKVGVPLDALALGAAAAIAIG